MQATIIIPARYGSSRLPGKPLLQFAGSTLLEHTWRAACRTGLPVWIATDDSRIVDEAKRIDACCIMTGECENGTERCADAARKLNLAGPIVNWQGDSPLVPPDWIPALLESLAQTQTHADVVTPVQRCDGAQARQLRQEFALGTPGGTAVAMTENFDALYFSKAPIPAGGPLWLHVGIYAYTRAALARYGRRRGTLEQSERLEQLRFLERGDTIRCVPFGGPPVWEVNHFADLRIVEQMMEDRREALRA